MGKTGGEMRWRWRKAGLGRRSRSTAVVAVLSVLAMLSVVGVYRLGYQHGQIAALESEVAR